MIPPIPYSRRDAGAALMLLAALIVAGCEPAVPAYLELTGATMGTTYNVKIAGAGAADARPAIAAQIDAALAEVDRQMSTWRDDSELERFNDAASTDWFAVSPEVVEVVAAAVRVSEQTGGAFDVTVGPLVDIWGFGPRRVDSLPPPAQAVETALTAVGFRGVEWRAEPAALRKSDPATRVDLSAIAKGYGVDRLADVVAAAGVTDYLIEIGGELRVAGRRGDGTPWRVAIEQPVAGRGNAAYVFEPPQGGVATSGDYRNFLTIEGRRYSHTIDPRNGWPVSHDLASVTVLTDTAMRADALATALHVLGPERAIEYARGHGVTALFVQRAGEDFELVRTGDFPAPLSR